MRLILIFGLVLVSVLADKQHPRLKSLPRKEKLNQEDENQFWITEAQHILSEKVHKTKNMNYAKNIIFFIGDGMSLQTVAASRMVNGGREENSHSFEKFPVFGLSKVFCVDKQVPDSACTGTAYSSGVKANYGTIGVNAQVRRKDCEKGLDPETHTEPITLWAQRAGKSTGFVTTTRITHASPAAFYAHTADRDWENDAKVRSANCDPEKVDDIAEQLVHGEIGSKFNVIMGGGRREFRDTTMPDEEGKSNKRVDRKDLIQEWIESKEGSSAAYVWNRTDLMSLDYSKVDYLLGLFETAHCRYNLDIKNKRLREEPSLTDMVEAAIKLLRKNDNGFFLFVESGIIDTAHHDNLPHKALEETQELSRAVELVRRMTNEDDTLVVVTADHPHVMSYSGYPSRGSDILGFSYDLDGPLDNLPYLTLSYGNGEGYYQTYEDEGPNRVEITDSEISDPEYQYPALFPRDSETHGGDDVGVYASGPHAHIFTGNYEQNVIPILMAYAGELDQYIGKSAGNTIALNSWLLLSMGLIVSALTTMLRL